MDAEDLSPGQRAGLERTELKFRWEGDNDNTRGTDQNFATEVWYSHVRSSRTTTASIKTKIDPIIVVDLHCHQPPVGVPCCRTSYCAEPGEGITQSGPRLRDTENDYCQINNDKKQNKTKTTTTSKK